MKLFFDNSEIDAGSIVGLTYDATTHSNNFSLGSTVCKCFNIDIINTAFSALPDKVYIKDDNNNTLTTLYVDEVNTENMYYTSFTLTDYMLLTDFAYEANNQTVNSILTATLGTHWDSTMPYYGLDIQVNQNINVRDLISYLAEINAGYAYIDETDKVRITKYANSTGNEIDVAKCSSFTLGEHHVIDRVYLELAEASYYYPATTTNNTVYLNPNNVLITDTGSYTIESILQHIQSDIDGFEFYNISANAINVSDLGLSLPDAGKIVNFAEGSNKYQTILQCDFTYNMMWVGGFRLDLNTDAQQETTTTVESIVNKVNIKVDRALGTIEQQIIDNTGQISQLIQDASGLTGYFANVGSSKYIRLSADGIQVSKTPDDGSVNITEDGMYILNDQQVKVASMKENEFDTTNWIYSETRQGKCLNIFKRGIS